MGQTLPQDAARRLSHGVNFYLSAVDDQLRHKDDQPSIGLLLCKEKDRLIVEYALRDVKKPIGVAEWRTRLVESLPKKLQSSLPTAKQIEAELAVQLQPATVVAKGSVAGERSRRDAGDIGGQTKG